MKYKAVIFDLFGTLVDNFTIQGNANILTEMASILSLPADGFIKLWRETHNQRMIGAFRTCEANIIYVAGKIGVYVNPDAVKHATQRRFEFTLQSLTPRPDALEVLSQLKNQGCSTGLISDCSIEAPTIWRNTSFAKLIDVPLFSCIERIKKPDRLIYETIIKRLGVEANKCLYIGDGSSQELSGARAVGMFPVLIRVPYENNTDAYRIDEEEWHGPFISSLKEVLDLL